jgi:hypothetical protein
MASMAVRWRAYAERLRRPPKPTTSKLTAMVARRRVASRRRLKDTRAGFVTVSSR